MPFTSLEIRQIGLEKIGFTLRRQGNTVDKTNLRRFRDAFGTSPEACCHVLGDLQTTANEQARVESPDLVYFLMSLHWMKSYKTDTSLAATFQVDEKTARGWSQWYALKIQALKNEKVRGDSIVFGVYRVAVFSPFDFRSNGITEAKPSSCRSMESIAVSMSLASSQVQPGTPTSSTPLHSRMRLALLSTRVRLSGLMDPSPPRPMTSQSCESPTDSCRGSLLVSVLLRIVVTQVSRCVVSGADLILPKYDISRDAHVRVMRACQAPSIGE